MTGFKQTQARYCPVRRRLLLTAAAAGGLALSPWRLGWAATEHTMRRRPIPATGEELAVMGLGSSGSFSSDASDALADLRTVLDKFVAMGGEMVDTSPTYGDAETVIGRLARETGLRNSLFMATKVHIDGREAGVDQMQRSEHLLGKPIDLMQVHNFVDLDTQWHTLEQMKAKGVFRYIGITHYQTYAFDQLEHEMKNRDLDFVQLNYSVMTPDAEQRLLPLAADRGIAVIVNRAFNDGALFGAVSGQTLPDYAAEIGVNSWAQFALKYVLADPAVNVVIPATSDPEHLIDNMQAGYGALPDQAMKKRMRRTIEQL